MFTLTLHSGGNVWLGSIASAAVSLRLPPPAMGVRGQRPPENRFLWICRIRLLRIARQGFSSGRPEGVSAVVSVWGSEGEWAVASRAIP
jgi:hypothetical protein